MKTNKHAFTLIELLVTLSLIVIMAALVAPSFFSTLRKGRDDTAIKKAALLEVAKANLRYEKGHEYATNTWDTNTNEQSKYELLRSYLNTPPQNLGNGTTKTDYTPFGYRIFLTNAFTNPITVIRLEGNKQIYP
ncbi:MAG: type II secretion system protein [Verrucomicrobiota bacterium]